LDQDEATKRFYALVWPHSPTVLRAARYLVRNPAEADDIAQVTMIKAFKAIGSFQDGTDMRPWLMTILRNTRIDHIRAAAPSAGNVSFEQLGVEPADCSDDTGSDDDPAWDNPEELLEGFSDCHVIEALHKLPEEIRWTLLLVEVEEMDHEDAAKVLGVPVGTVKSRAFRGRGMLRQALLPVAKELRLIR
jgi:RNA polymerase sigma-70 factor (ECF subfamily)